MILFEEQRLFTYISAVFDLAESTSCKPQGDSNASSGEANDMRSDETVISIVPNVRLHVCNIFWTWMMGHGCEPSMERVFSKFECLVSTTPEL